MLKSACNKIINSYNKVIQYVNTYLIEERGNPYGHASEFNKLKKDIKCDAHRVISPLALKLVGIEDTYSVTDINGNTYKFNIFENGYYRVCEVVKLNEKMEATMNERSIK